MKFIHPFISSFSTTASPCTQGHRRSAVMGQRPSDTLDESPVRHRITAVHQKSAYPTTSTRQRTLTQGGKPQKQDTNRRVGAETTGWILQAHNKGRMTSCEELCTFSWRLHGFSAGPQASSRSPQSRTSGDSRRVRGVNECERSR